MRLAPASTREHQAENGRIARPIAGRARQSRHKAAFPPFPALPDTQTPLLAWTSKSQGGSDNSALTESRYCQAATSRQKS